MTEPLVLGEQLLQWLSARSRRSREFGRDAVERVLAPKGRDKSGFWRYFFPLLRQGHVEQSGEGQRYQVCSPTLRWLAESGRAVWLGARVEQAYEALSQAAKDELVRERGFEGYPDRWLLMGESDFCRQTAERLGIRFSDQSVLPFAKHLAPLSVALAAIPGETPGSYLRQSEREELRRSGVIKLGGTLGSPPCHWLVLEEGAPPRRLLGDFSIQTARWFMRYRSSGAAASFKAGVLTLPVWTGYPLPPILERLLTLETGGPEAGAGMRFSFVSDEFAREILRVVNA